ncbi:uncharacterized protein LDX57_009193 [Aspergillus melleus]|uniref:uncharacterized protein n=1 Tax=Aspergillus melleus TaxID=138277 RepID=UPI001E8DBCA9|nr:uncharacterized protein LDX57_009193 [Aspergillus melleus]KAH8431531.1 hypothetical protein LDX57_009193 [Aspergillus melleus]
MSYSSTSSSASESDPGTSVPARDYANLRDMTAFPTFFDIPELMIQVANGKVYKPHEHWCLLVEIFAIESFSRLVLRCKDKADKLVIIAFYTEDEGRAFDTSELHCGQTVAIMYPTQHQFLDGRWGVRQEDYRSIKVCPRFWKSHPSSWNCRTERAYISCSFFLRPSTTYFVLVTRFDPGRKALASTPNAMDVAKAMYR